MTDNVHHSVLLIGGSRGLGLAIAEEYLDLGAQVAVTVRSPDHPVLDDLAHRADGRLRIEQLDITEPAQIKALHDTFAQERFDLLFVNAGITNRAEETSADVSSEVFARLMLTNALSPMRVIETLGDLVEPHGTIAIMSSGQGSIANNERGGFEIYRASKSALNQLMRGYAARHRADTRTLLLMAPGWVKTELGGPGAALEIHESIPRLVAVIESQHGQPGLQYLDYQGRTIAW